MNLRVGDDEKQRKRCSDANTLLARGAENMKINRLVALTSVSLPLIAHSGAHGAYTGLSVDHSVAQR